MLHSEGEKAENAENARFTGLAVRPGTEAFLLHLFAFQVLSKPRIYGFNHRKGPMAFKSRHLSSLYCLATQYVKAGN